MRDDEHIKLGLGALELSVIVPTFNEVANCESLIALLDRALAGLEFEIIFVDDHSPDGTADLIRSIAQKSPRVRCIERVGRRGLSSAVIEGMMASSAPFAAVIDGDLQHDERKLSDMLNILKSGEADIVVGSRYTDGGGTSDWDASRLRMSKLATRIGKLVTKVKLSDPMSGFFMIRMDSLRERVEDLTGVGYKILLDILSAKGPALRVREIAYEFKSRQAGDSKLDNKVALEFVEMLIARTLGRHMPTKFVMFSLVGSLGVVVHMVALWLLFQVFSVSFGLAQGAATLIAMTTNFFINNVFTYFDKRLTGWRLLSGWLSFALASSIGAIANVSVAVYLFANVDAIWFLSAIAGVVVGSAWNYAVTALYTWRN